MNWWEDRSTVLDVARWLDDRDEWGDAPSAVIDYFEAPWKWTPEYRRWAEQRLLDALAVSEEHHA